LTCFCSASVKVNASAAEFLLAGALAGALGGIGGVKPEYADTEFIADIVGVSA
jgi:hypothetical protein